MRHKIRIRRGQSRYWYVECECRGIRHRRDTWDAAFAVGVAHQLEAKDTCDCE